MNVEHHGDSNEKSAAERLAELTGEPVEKFECDGPIPDAEEQDWKAVDE